MAAGAYLGSAQGQDLSPTPLAALEMLDAALGRRNRGQSRGGSNGGYESSTPGSMAAPAELFGAPRRGMARAGRRAGRATSAGGGAEASHLVGGTLSGGGGGGDEAEGGELSLNPSETSNGRNSKDAQPVASLSFPQAHAPSPPPPLHPASSPSPSALSAGSSLTASGLGSEADSYGRVGGSVTRAPRPVPPPSSTSATTAAAWGVALVGAPTPSSAAVVARAAVAASMQALAGQTEGSSVPRHSQAPQGSVVLPPAGPSRWLDEHGVGENSGASGVGAQMSWEGSGEGARQPGSVPPSSSGA